MFSLYRAYMYWNLCLKLACWVCLMQSLDWVYNASLSWWTATGTNAVISVNVDTAKYVRDKILTSMAQKKMLQHSFKKKNKLSHSVHQLSKSTMSSIHIDPQLTVVSKVHHSRDSEWPVGKDLPIRTLQPSPSNLRGLVMRPANKPALADSIWALMP